ncbi:family 43 glycosylhydrolase [Segetibacter sp. 3557_3]|uniref:glycoside hydrolase family 43 protein n=1 Tax=Segetibacter sp. 3557_3 TaxID=2547429 RepID=UPI001FB5FEE5|nr:glycoside hydrolase family 43 protein [Segetibacter sp. 3557_3]
MLVPKKNTSKRTSLYLVGHRRHLYLMWLLLLCFNCNVQRQPESRTTKTFTNPLLPRGADPWSIFKDGFYYYTHTLSDSLVIYKTSNLADLATAERKTVYVPPKNTAYSKQLWAPEIHFIGGKWYMYFAADDGKNENHRMYVLENASADPLSGTWTFKGQVTDKLNRWAIDGSVFQLDKQLYMVWSGWDGERNGQQDIYIAKMLNPWTIVGDRVRISSPTYTWEKHGELRDNNNPPNVYVNEGPQILLHNKDFFLLYSASGCWTDQYVLGMLSTKRGNNLLDSSKWTKHPEPVFKRAEANSVYAPGHNSFFKSPDGTEDWILYHANSAPGQGCGRFRSPRAQRFTWNSDGTPNFGEPVKTSVPLAIPSENKPRKNQHRLQ